VEVSPGVPCAAARGGGDADDHQGREPEPDRRERYQASRAHFRFGTSSRVMVRALA
jgi:hypothetical protein